jgi:hypothetical protein
MTEFKTTHNLLFEVAPWELNIDDEKPFLRFKVGTCYGLYRSTPDSYDILSVNNTEIGNGHFEDVMEWFENSCKRDNRNLKVLETWNPLLREHLITKRGFVKFEGYDLIKYFKK